MLAVPENSGPKVHVALRLEREVVRAERVDRQIGAQRHRDAGVEVSTVARRSGSRQRR